MRFLKALLWGALALAMRYTIAYFTKEPLPTTEEEYWFLMSFAFGLGILVASYSKWFKC